MGLRKTEATGLVGWVDQRLSIMDAWNNHLAQYWAPKISMFGISSAHSHWWFW